MSDPAMRVRGTRGQKIALWAGWRLPGFVLHLTSSPFEAALKLLQPFSRVTQSALGMYLVLSAYPNILDWSLAPQLPNHLAEHAA